MKCIKTVLTTIISLTLFGCGGGGGDNNYSEDQNSETPELTIISSLEINENVYDIAVEDNCIYAAVGSDGIQIFDIRDIRNPEISGQIDPYGTVPDSADFFTQVAIIDRVAYSTVTPGCSGDCLASSILLRIYNLNDPTNPEFLSQIDIPVVSFLAESNTLYATCLNSTVSSLNIIDVSTPSDPVTLSTISTDILDAEAVIPGGEIFKIGNLLFNPYNNSSSFESIQVINVTDPENPSVLNKPSAISLNIPHSQVSYYENYAYVADGSNGLRIFDLTAPLTPLEVESIPTEEPATSLCAWNGYLYAVDNLSGVSIYDLADPELPEFYTLIDTPSKPLNVFLSDSVGMIVTEEIHVDGSLVENKKINLFLPKTKE
ncbi:hypothetical protein [Desulfuromonas acetoxidans]|uniref:LVIVD repeat-containing protein n=1 Tax=Desulfuromonas acetoxidans TaxID=891 RepID=UPI00292F9CCE|nr:hypothetical protein [Desulfuromonas acetoxidans]